MSDTATQERRSALDDFAAATANAVVPASPAPLPVPPAQQPLQLYRAPDRDERRVLSRIRELAAAVGGDWYYRYPVRNKRKGTTDWIEGPSIKCADDVAHIFGNCLVDCPVVADMGHVILFQARFVDTETGFTLVRPFQQSKSASRIGGSDDDRRDDGAFQIGVSKAQRNVIRNALRTYVDFAFDEARNSLVTKIGQDIDRWRKNTVDAVSKLCALNRVEAVVGRAAGDWLAPDIARVRAMGKAIQDGMATVEETFPPLAGEQESKLDKFASGTTAADPSSTVEPDPAGAAVPETLTAPAEPDEREMVKPDKGALLKLHRMCIDKILGAAQDKKLPDPEDRIANIEGPVRDIWEAQSGLDPTFVATALALAVAVVRGERTDVEFRKLMEARVP